MDLLTCCSHIILLNNVLESFGFGIKNYYACRWGFPGSSTGKESTCNAGDPGLILGSGVGAKGSLEEGIRDRLSTPVFLGFPGGSDGKESVCNSGDLGLIPGLGRSPGEVHGNPLQYSCLENSRGQRNLADYSL